MKQLLQNRVMMFKDSQSCRAPGVLHQYAQRFAVSHTGGSKGVSVHHYVWLNWDSSSFYSSLSLQFHFSSLFLFPFIIVKQILKAYLPMPPSAVMTSHSQNQLLLQGNLPPPMHVTKLQMTKSVIQVSRHWGTQL